MAKLVKLAVALGILACIAYGVFVWSQSRDEGKAADDRQGEPLMGVEEKYGFTTETAGG